MNPGQLLSPAELKAALEAELNSHNSLLPPRPDHAVLLANVARVDEWLRSSISRPGWGGRSDVIFADKGAKGARPLSVLTLQDRVVFRALVTRLSSRLPDGLQQRASFSDFSSAPLEVVDAHYVTLLDVSAYYVYVDHEMLVDELIAQTGDALVVGELAELLHKVMGRRIGLPQISSMSDILGDTHLDRVRRRLVRQGFHVSRFADDFRITTGSLGEAREAVEACAAELYTLGLVLNDEKTLTYRKENYAASLTKFADAERDLFAADQLDDPFLDVEDPVELLGLLNDGGTYPDEQIDDAEDTDDAMESDADSAGTEPISSFDTTPAATDADGIEAVHSSDGDGDRELTDAHFRAAVRAWQLWQRSSRTSRQDHSVARTLLHRALPILGAAGETGPLGLLDSLLSAEPGLTPQIAQYLAALPTVVERNAARFALDQLLAVTPPLSAWQKMWIAHAAGKLRRRVSEPQRYFDWLDECLESKHDGLVATAATSLGRLRLGDRDKLARALDSVGPQWRSSVLWALGRVDLDLARDLADSDLDRIMLENM